MSSLPRLSRRSILLLALFAALLWFANLDYRKLIKPDEGRYAEISREMAVSGDWITPRLNGIKYFEKPPLHYWANAAAMSVFGPNEWTARWWSAATGAMGIVLLWLVAQRLFAARAGLYAATMLASSLMYFAMGHLNTLDMGLSFFLTLALGGFLMAQRDAATRGEIRLWMHLAWAAMAAAVLTKGLIGLAIPGSVLVLYTLIQRDFEPWRRLHIVTGLPLFLALCAPWFIVVSLRNPEFPWFFFIHEHWLRYTTTIHQRVEPWHYFLPLLIAGALPWTLVVGDALWRGWRLDPAQRFQPRRFLIVWCGFVLLFFSASGSKLPSYILPLFPAAMLLGAWRLTTMRPRTLAWCLTPMIAIGIGALIAMPFVHSSGDTPPQLIENYKPWIYCAGAVMALATATAFWLGRREHRTFAVLTAAAGAIVAAQLLLAGHDEMSPSMSAYALAQRVKPFVKPDTPFYSVGTYDQTLDFYIGRTVTLVEFRDELEFGIQQEPALAIPTVGEWIERWKREPYAIAYLEKIRYDQLVEAGLPMVLIANDHRRYFVRTP